MQILLIAAGGALGAVLRYLVTGWVQTSARTAFPVGTMAVNLGGCLAIGFLAAAATGSLHLRESYRLALVVGLLGGFTTFSTFAFDTFILVERGRLVQAAGNLVLANLLGVAGVWAGVRLAGRIYGA